MIDGDGSLDVAPFPLRSASTNKSWIEAHVTDMMAVGQPCHETIQTEPITTMGECAILTLKENGRVTMMSKRTSIFPYLIKIPVVWVRF